MIVKRVTYTMIIGKNIKKESLFCLFFFSTELWYYGIICNVFYGKTQYT